MALDLNKLKSLFIVTEETDNKEQKENEEVENKETVTPPPAKVEEKINEPIARDERIKRTLRTENKNNQPNNENTPVASVVTNTTGSFDQKIFESLDKALKQSNLPGEDYIELVEALDAMKNLPMDESIKIQSVLATLSTKGLTKEKVIQSAEYYISELEKEKRKFEDAARKQTEEQVTKRQKEITALEELNKAKELEIARLNQEINKNKEDMVKIKAQMEEAQQKINATTLNFNATFDFFVNQIKANVNKIK